MLYVTRQPVTSIDAAEVWWQGVKRLYVENDLWFGCVRHEECSVKSSNFLLGWKSASVIMFEGRMGVEPW